MSRDPDSTQSTGFDPHAENHREELLALLKRPLRRRVLRHLDPEMESVPLSELVDSVADPDDCRKKVVAALHHNHLPRLADHGLVEYDYRRNVVTPTFDERVEPFLDWLER